MVKSTKAIIIVSVMVSMSVMLINSCGVSSPTGSSPQTPALQAGEEVTLQSNSLDSVIIVASSAQYTNYKLQIFESNQSASSTPINIASTSKGVYHITVKPDKTYILILSQYKQLSAKPCPVIILSSPDIKNQKRINTILTKAQQPSIATVLMPNALTTSTGSQIYMWRLTYIIEVNWQGTNGNPNGWIPDNYLGTNGTPYTFDLSPDSSWSYYLDLTGQPCTTIDLGQYLLPDGSYLLARQKLTNCTAITIQSLSFSSQEITMQAGTSKYIPLKATLSTGEIIDISNDIIWNSSDPVVANGGSWYISGKNEGTAQISASFCGATATTKVTVTGKMPYEVNNIGSLSISLFTLDGAFDGSRGGQLFVTEPDGTVITDEQTPQSGHGQVVFNPGDGIYQSNYYRPNPEAGVYTIQVKQYGCSVYPKPGSKATWIVSGSDGFYQVNTLACDGSWDAGSIKVNAPNKKKLKSIAVTPDKATVYIHNLDVTKTQQQFNANGKYTDGSSQNINDTATWVADPSGLVTLTNGLTKALKPGKAMIKASLNSIISNDAELIIACRKYPSYYQQDYQDVYDHHRFFFPIAKKGCALTSLSMILDSIPMAYPYKPDQLNTIFNLSYNNITKQSLGYDNAGVKWSAINKLTNPKKINFYTANIPPSDIDLNPKGYFEDFELKNLSDIDQYLDACMPVIVGVRIDQTPGNAGTPSKTHYILVTGRDGNKYFINDPWDPGRTTLDYYDNKIYAYIIYKINF